MADNLCDGLGACLGECPTGALTIEIREADAFDEEAVQRHLQAGGNDRPVHSGCPGSMMRVLQPQTASSAEPEAGTPSELAQWPVQLKLVNSYAPYFKNADLLIAADCVPFAYADFHRKFLRGRAVAMGCPKLDDAMYYL
ncbi:MAG TPA: 4Fe-4S ferredoxin, partial [Firmicutes bacterium]|nr:4Fe-4S ferredoxin [Bacillota bacterium]